MAEGTDGLPEVGAGSEQASVLTGTLCQDAGAPPTTRPLPRGPGQEEAAAGSRGSEPSWETTEPQSPGAGTGLRWRKGGGGRDERNRERRRSERSVYLKTMAEVKLVKKKNSM